MKRNLKSLRPWTALLALAFFLTPIAQAQPTAITTEANDAPAWDQDIGMRLVGSLASPDAGVRMSALTETVSYAQFNEGQIDLAATVPVLLSIYRQDPEEPCRLTAVAALHAIGDATAMTLLRAFLPQQTSPRVQLATLMTLKDYYGLRTFEGDEEMAALAEALLERYRPEGRKARQPHEFTAKR
jgi:hypothetical protein